MSELRQDPVSREWVIIATERAKRPHQLVRAISPPVVEAYSPTCPFCRGNEHLTPHELMAFRSDGTPDAPNWWVRVVPNLYPALQPEGSLERTAEMNFFRKMDGVGAHEIVIETPIHNEFFPFLSEKQAEEVILIYLHRFRELRKDTRFSLIVIFKNHGESAGTSLIHPHSQIVASPIVPADVRKKFEEAERHFDDSGRCVYCEVREKELASGKRVVDENEHFVVFHPFASRVPFETWILPKRMCASFGLIRDDEAKSLGRVLKKTIHKLSKGLNNPDYNYIIHSAPFDDEEAEYFLWHVRILPRLTVTAGFELGSGIYINTACPEETAAFIRNVTIP